MGPCGDRSAVDSGEEGGDLKVVAKVLVDGGGGGGETDADLLASLRIDSECDRAGDRVEGGELSRTFSRETALVEAVARKGSRGLLVDGAGKEGGAHIARSKGRSEGDGDAIGILGSDVCDLVFERDSLRAGAEETVLVVSGNKEVIETEIRGGLVSVKRKVSKLFGDGNVSIDEDGAVRVENVGSGIEQKVKTVLFSVGCGRSNGLPCAAGCVAEELEIEVGLETVAEEVGVKVAGGPERSVGVVGIEGVCVLVRGNVVIRGGCCLKVS